MGLTFNLGRISPSVFTDSSLNVGIGGSPSGSYKLEVTGTAKVSSTLLVSGAATFSSSVGIASSAYTMGSVTSGLLNISTDLILQSLTNGQNGIFYNAWLNASNTWTRINASYATGMRQVGGGFQFHCAPSSTANSTLSNWDTTDVKMTITNGGNVCINTTSINGRLGTNTKLTVAGSGSNAAGNSGASMGAVAGTGSAAIDTGINVEATDGGLTLLFLASRNTSSGTNTASAVYIISFYYNSNFPVVTYLGGTSNFVTFGQSGNNLTATNAIGYGNFNCSWFASK